MAFDVQSHCTQDEIDVDQCEVEMNEYKSVNCVGVVQDGMASWMCYWVVFNRQTCYAFEITASIIMIIVVFVRM